MNIELNGDHTPSQLVNDIGLCYYDPTSENLKEFDPNVSITVGPFEVSVRRFYIVKPSGSIQNKVYSKVKVKVESDSFIIEHKIKIGGERISIPSDFSEFDLNNEVIALFSHHSTGIIPVDVYTRCTAPVSSENYLTFTLEVD